jgi:hypothetical protein
LRSRLQDRGSFYREDRERESQQVAPAPHHFYLRCTLWTFLSHWNPADTLAHSKVNLIRSLWI